MRRAALRRARGALADLKYARSRREQAEADMIALLSGLGVDAGRICEIPGLSPVTLAAILAETGDLHKYESSSSVVKHAGMSPARNESGSFRGQAKISRRGRPVLRLAAWRATWAVLRHCDVLAAKHAALTSRDDDSKLTPEQARVACAASLLRWIWSLTVHGTRWDPRIAAGTARPPPRHRRITAGCSPANHEPRRPRVTSGHFPTGKQARHHVEDHLAGNPGQLPRPARGPSPARLNAVGTPSPLELRRAQEPRAAIARDCRSLAPSRTSQGTTPDALFSSSAIGVILSGKPAAAAATTPSFPPSRR